MCSGGGLIVVIVTIPALALTRLTNTRIWIHTRSCTRAQSISRTRTRTRNLTQTPTTAPPETEFRSGFGFELDLLSKFVSVKVSETFPSPSPCFPNCWLKSPSDEPFGDLLSWTAFVVH